MKYFFIIFILFSSFYCSLFSQDLDPKQIYKQFSQHIFQIQVYNKANQEISSGTGILLDSNGYCITCFHVIEGGSIISIRDNYNNYKFEDLIYIDVENDLAVLKISSDDLLKSSLNYVNLNNLEIGEKVYTISNPKGLFRSFSEGIISNFSKNRIQITAAISPGSSGGLVLNSNGKAVGIISSSVKDGQNLNFVIPMELIDFTKFCIDTSCKEKIKIIFNLYNLFVEALYEETLKECLNFKETYNDDKNLDDLILSLYQILGIQKNEIKYLELALQMNPNNSYTYFLFSKIFSEKGDLNNQILYLQYAIHYDPYNAYYNFLISDAYKNRMNKSAREHYLRVAKRLGSKEAQNELFHLGLD